MDSNVCWSNEKKIERTIEALGKNNINGYHIQSRGELLEKIKELVSEGATVSCGGSATLTELGLLEHLRSGRYEFLDRAAKGITEEEKKEIHRKTFSADAFFTSTNALTEDGQLFNVDGGGNRVAAMLFGPDKVLVVCGVNKIVKNIEEAIERNKRVSAPINAKRLNRNTPCAKVGYCMDCSSNDRICNEYTVIKRQGDKTRMHVLILNENLGY
ncbi:lactate utilization protein [Clostridium manihotivorum]|uniref:Lactate utilization protein n=1 Tax=Clostridium manihotivorum TaxID=2320868 RepID=A0A3R5U3A9_9CLOT|nr:lactate utilization protein [Clostridium manihotivorum]QAA30459.1 lactate utilization protein [Clostridium manihotivorum]